MMWLVVVIIIAILYFVYFRRENFVGVMAPHRPINYSVSNMPPIDPKWIPSDKSDWCDSCSGDDQDCADLGDAYGINGCLNCPNCKWCDNGGDEQCYGTQAWAPSCRNWDPRGSDGTGKWCS